MPGKYTIKVLVRDDATGKIGTFQTTFVIPNLNKETKRVAISTWYAERAGTYEGAIYNATKGRSGEGNGADPLCRMAQAAAERDPGVQQRAESVCVPAGVRAQGSSGDNPGLRSETWGTRLCGTCACGRTTEPLIAFVSFYRMGRRYMRRSRRRFRQIANTRLEMAPMNFTID